MAEEPSKDPITSLTELKKLLYANIAKSTKYEVKPTPKPLSEQRRLYPRRGV